MKYEHPKLSNLFVLEINMERIVDIPTQYAKKYLKYQVIEHVQNQHESANLSVFAGLVVGYLTASSKRHWRRMQPWPLGRRVCAL